MKKHISNFFLLVFLLSSTLLEAQKTVYIPTFITNTGMDLNNTSSQWCYARSKQTDNIVVFWEAGFGSDPSTATGTYNVDMTTLLTTAEKSYATYIDLLKFAVKGSSVTDKYKLMIFLLYSTEWAAYGSGQDNKVGTLHVNPAAANIGNVLAHEIGHCFQYITGCDTKGGYRYGFGANASGGNGFWEQCAQWMAFKVYPSQKFTDYDFSNYIANTYRHILHEEPRYANYFVQDYWIYKRGLGALGKMWRESVSPEDPVETYKRLYSLTQTQFNDEMYEHASRLTTWDLPATKSYGANYINSRSQTKMNLINNFWRIDTSVCIQNYGYNCIKLNVPSTQTTVSVNFKGLAGQAGYTAINTNLGGWRYGFVALLNDGTRVYGSTNTANYSNGTNPNQQVSFTCPANCKNLWLVVSGAPQTHWRHPWDDNNATDEEWPYEVQFTNTNLLGYFTNPIHNDTLTYTVNMLPKTDYSSTAVSLDASRIYESFAMPQDSLNKYFGNKIVYAALNPDGTTNSTSTANAPGHWFNKTGTAVSWGSSAYIFSELNMSTLTANIGQYPNNCKAGDKYTIKQKLTYTKSSTEKATVVLIFNINITSITDLENENGSSILTTPFPNPTENTINWNKETNWKIFDSYGNFIVEGFGTQTTLDNQPKGMYFLQLENKTIKIVKE